ncbi:MAG: hypothetical protein WBY44_06840 [Bryobacteraceae bacterium]|jgi:hypothetical protein
MTPLGGPHNQSYPGEVGAAVEVAWSQRRAWHGDTVKIYVAAEFAKKNPAVEVKILAKDATTIDTPAGATLSDYSAGYSYDLKWKGKAFGANREFVLTGKVGGKLDSDPSKCQPLYVDLDTPAFSF